MEKYAWKATAKAGCIEEYKRRHDNLWQEMKDLLKSAGIHNYSIWNNGNELFGYYECIFGIEYASKLQSTSKIVEKWNEYMKDILIMEIDPKTNIQPHLTKIFDLE